MKVLIKIIISLFFIFSILTTSFAQKEGQIENILNLNYGIETLEINNITMDNYYFNDYNTYKTYNSFKNTSRLLKNEIIKQYKNSTIGYYKMNGLIKDYTDFIYYSNKYFFFLKQKEIYPNDKSLNYTIINTLTQIKSSYMKIKFLLLK